MTANESNKRETMESFLAEGMVQVLLDSRREGVEVPDHLKGDPMLRLNISGRFGLPLEVDDWGIHATLTFSGDPFECKLPWPSVYIMLSHVTGEPCFFPSDVPQEYVSEALGQLKNAGIAPKPQKAEESTEESSRTHLRLVPVAEESESKADVQPDDNEPEDPSPDDDPTPTPPKKPFLSVVK